MSRVAAALLALSLSAPAAADDEGSSQTARVVGRSADTLGVEVSFDRARGWVMKVRARPGGKQRTVALPALGRGHAHFHVYVSPGRARITFVETFIGLDNHRSGVDKSDPFARTWTPAGKLLQTVTYGQVFSAAELARFQRSVSHLSWMREARVSKRGLELAVAGSKRVIVVDARTGAVK